METALDRFLRYVALDTTSHEESLSTPSTPGQFDLAHLLVDELHALGLTDAAVDSNCYVMATLPATSPQLAEQPVMGWIAHLDTSESSSGKNIRPRRLLYTGGDIALNEKTILREDANLRQHTGEEILVTDGTTLLGADDKAGIAAIMTALDMLQSSDAEHTTIRVAFTPDEELGRGTDHFNQELFNAEYAYTVDGPGCGIMNCETFTADRAELVLHGMDTHPGTAKDMMKHASLALSSLLSKLPHDRRAETTSGREPFIHLLSMSGDVNEAKASFILRAFDEPERNENKKILQQAFDTTLAEAGVTGTLEIHEQYRNMKPFLARYPEVTTHLEEAVRRLGLVPKWELVRGGTDGARLSEQGLPTPNLFYGGYNPHGVTEWLAVEGLNKSACILRELALIAASAPSNEK
ncbi:MAG: peptidase T [Planctomycetia bacterium]|nr:peptidase T [Planctomycetia bacterium]